MDPWNMPSALFCRTLANFSLSPLFLLDLHIPGLWSHPGLGCPPGRALCLQGQRMGWLRQHQELQHQGMVGWVAVQ